MDFKPPTLLNQLQQGHRMLKIPNKSTSRPEERLIKLELLPLQISWESKRKKPVLSTLDFDTIKEIRLGQSTKAFQLHGIKPEYEDRAFSIIYSVSGEYKILNLVAPTNDCAMTWVYGLHLLLLTQDTPEALDLTMQGFLKKMWKTIDFKNQDKLNIDDVTTLMRRLNINLSKLEVKSTFKNAGIHKLDSISFDIFERLYRILRFRPEISELFNSLSCSDASSLCFEEFKKFLLEFQKVDWSEDRMHEVYQKYSSSGFMTLDHFSAFLISANNTVFRKSHKDVYQNMALPLHHYYINTSHNT
jgi:Ca2+-binding EF-hand superfamily protein